MIRIFTLIAPTVVRRLKWPESKKGLRAVFTKKGSRGRPLTKHQQERNRNKSKTRARVEHLVACMTNSMNELYLCYQSFRRNATS
ncbi:MAG: transposase [Sphingobacteriales bacterium]